MVLEWIRRRNPTFDRVLRAYLFTEGEITQLEAEEEGEGPRTKEPGVAGGPGAPPRPPTLGSLRKK